MFNNIKTNFIIARTFIGIQKKSASFSSFTVTEHSGCVTLNLSIYLSKFF